MIADASADAPACAGDEPLDDQTLDGLQRSAFNYFVHAMNPANGLIADSSRDNSPCSIAVVGLALSVYPVGVEHGSMARSDAVERSLAALRFFYQATRDFGAQPGLIRHVAKGAGSYLLLRSGAASRQNDRLCSSAGEAPSRSRAGSGGYGSNRSQLPIESPRVTDPRLVGLCHWSEGPTGLDTGHRFGVPLERGPSVKPHSTENTI